MQGKMSVAAGHRNIAQYHKSSSVANGPAPHEYGPGSLKNEIQVNAIR